MIVRVHRYCLLLLALIGSLYTYAYDFDVDGIYYNKLSDNQVEVTFGNDNYSGEVILPEKIYYMGIIYSVSSIGASAFEECSGLTSITIPNSVTSIGNFAFAHCSGLTSVTIPNSVTSIGYCTFQYCSGLTSVTIPNSVTSIGEYTFQDCSGLTSVTIPNCVTSIGVAAFEGCSGLITISIGSGIKYIYSHAFASCISVVDLYCHATNVPQTNNNAFEDSYIELTTLHVPESAISSYREIAPWSEFKTITDLNNGGSGGSSAPSGTAEINGIYYTLIGKGAIAEVASGPNKYSGEIIIPSSASYGGYSYRVTSIGSSAFSYCSGLTSVTIPNSVTSIGSSSFYNCSGLTSVTIPSSVTSIGDGAFKECSGLTSVTIPNSVTSIGNNAFFKCIGLTSVTIPNSVTSIGHNAFFRCNSLTSVTIPNSVTSIGKSSFEDCSGLTTISIGSGIKTISSYAFASCMNVADVYCHATDVPSTSGDAFKDSYIENASLHVPESAISSYRGTAPWSRFKTIIGLDETKTYTLSISTFGNGSATYGGTTIHSNTCSFTVNEGTSATITFIPDNGNRIKSVKVNNIDVTSSVSNNSYTVDNISSNISVDVVFEAIPPTTYSLSITASGNGSAAYGGTVIRSNTSSFTVNEGDYATVTFSPDSGYRIASVKVNDIDVTSSVSDNWYTISNITANTTLSVVFEAIPPTMRTLTITASGNGSVQYGSTTVRNQTSAIEVEEGSSATVTFGPDGGNRIATVTVNGQDVTASIENYRYTIANISGDVTIVVAFEENISAVVNDGVSYTVVSQDDGTVKVAAGNYGQVLTVPASFTANDRTWQVTGIETDALKDNVGLAAVIWNPEVAFTATVSNPNLLLYVKSEAYAPQAIHNVVVNGTAANITLVEAVDGNDFYCPQTFTAQKISYSHSYGMQTGIRESRGWETIALPFDVQTITHETKGTIVPFANWKNGDTSKPFWLMELTGTGFVESGSIKAYTPYIISMPNHPQYDSQWLLNGKVTFAASSVTVGKTEDMNQSVFNGRTFIPCFAGKKVDEGFYALNVNNDWETNNSGMTEGSMFVWRLRNVHPFEAYLTSSSSAPRYAIGVFEDMTTGIKQMVDGRWMIEDAVYDLQGRKVESPSKKGVYIMNGKKKVVK